ncbi:deoxycytidylate deaminase [Primorskyibacter flagellatus]|uniref:dCMP deaminase n=1 Tax=Primorskyibacter flagellatus TaxID=1387277 RepID=A0A1W2D236_9RHOB|nr:deaminase [Primorskyibacter flagellatus]SMC91118.1 dCMP deaminase [Primorskyibacter flagellatus]
MANEDVWATRFVALAREMASWSEDRDRHVGAVIVGQGHEVRASGYNGLPRGVSAAEDARFDRASGEKFHWVEHAERNAIYNAARSGAALEGCTIYVTRFPCADCARAIIQSGIACVVSPARPENDGALDHSFEVSEVMLAEAGIAFTAVPELP